MLASLHALAALTVLVLAAWGIGQRLLRALDLVDDRETLEFLAWSTASGLVLGTLGIALLGLASLWYRPLITGVVVLLAIDGWRTLTPVLRLPRLKPTDEGPHHAPPAWLQRGLACCVGVVLLSSLSGALAPPTAGDALCYHLELPKRYLIEHAWVDLSDHENGTFPLLCELGYLAGLCLGSDATAALLHWFWGVMLAVGSLLLAEPLVGRSWARVVAALVLSVPGVNNQMTAPLNDVALAALTTLALAAWWRAAILDRGAAWYVLAGVLLGGAVGVKFVALPMIVAVGVVWLVRGASQAHDTRRAWLSGAVTIATVAISVGGVWYVRSAWYRGDPVYPFLTSQAVTQHESLPAHKRPLGDSALALATAPWQLTMHSERLGGRSHQWGPLLLMLVPGVVLVRRLHGLGVLLAIAGVYGLVWFMLRQNIRFLLPIAPLLVVPSVWVVQEMFNWPAAPRRVALLVTSLMIVLLTAIPVYRARNTARVALGLESRDDYVQRVEPTARVAQFLREHVGSDTHILSEEQRAFYLPGRVTREALYRRRTHYDEQLASPTELGEQLRRDGFTHLLLAEAADGDPSCYSGRLRELVERACSAGDRTLRTLETFSSSDAEQGVRHYRLVCLY